MVLSTLKSIAIEGAGSPFWFAFVRNRSHLRCTIVPTVLYPARPSRTLSRPWVSYQISTSISAQTDVYVSDATIEFHAAAIIFICSLFIVC